MIALLTGGHLLLQGMPGLATTLLVNNIAKAINLDFKNTMPAICPFLKLGACHFQLPTGPDGIRSNAPPPTWRPNSQSDPRTLNRNSNPKAAFGNGGRFFVAQAIGKAARKDAGKSCDAGTDAARMRNLQRR